MELTLKSGETIEISDTVFSTNYNQALVHQVVQSYISNGHQGTKAQKSRSDVRGGGAKPYKQKGTGRARAGTRSSPIWRGGGVTFAAKPHVSQRRINRKMYRGAMKCILSELLRKQRLTVVENLDLDSHQTQALNQALHELNHQDSLLILSNPSSNVQRAAANLKSIELLTASRVNPAALIQAKKVLMDVDSMRQLESQLS